MPASPHPWEAFRRSLHPSCSAAPFKSAARMPPGDCVREVRRRRTPLEGEQQTLAATPTDRIPARALRRAAHRARLARVTPILPGSRAARTGRRSLATRRGGVVMLTTVTSPDLGRVVD